MALFGNRGWILGCRQASFIRDIQRRVRDYDDKGLNDLATKCGFCKFQWWTWFCAIMLDCEIA